MTPARAGRRWRRLAMASLLVVLIAALVMHYGPFHGRVGDAAGATAITTVTTDSLRGEAAAQDSGGPGVRASTSAPVLAAVPADSTRPGTMSQADRPGRIRVRVLNTTGVHGLAKRMTFLLRDAGFDVVDFDSDLKQRAPATRILVHSAHPEWAERVRQAIGVGMAVNRPDSLRALDLTVLIGPDWRAPAQPLRP